MNNTEINFRTVKPDAPCEVCGKGDWCRRSSDGAIECHRESTDVAGFKRLKVTQSGYGLYRRSDDRVLAQAPTHRASTPAARSAPPPATPAPKPAAYATVDDYERTLGNRHGGTWHYHNADGTPAMAVVRINLDGDKKEFRPLHPVDGGWAFGDPPGKLPLYRLPSLIGADRVFVLEGEKKTDLCAECGWTATTSAHGSNSPGKTDWTPLAGREWIIFPDKNKAGDVYAKSVARIGSGLNPPARCRIVDLPVNADEDFEEFRVVRTPSEVRRDIQPLIDATPYYVHTPDNAPPTDSGTPDLGPPWQTPAEIGMAPSYRKGLIPLPTGFKALDDELGGGLRPEGVYPLAGRTGHAKSTLAGNIIRHVAVAGNAVLLFKLEESPREALWRIHAATAKVPFRILLNGEMHTASAANRAALDDAWTLVRGLPIRISDQRNIDAIRRISKLHVEQGGKLIVIDQTSQVMVEGAAFGYERATIASNSIRMLAKELSVPVLLVSQVGRESAKSKDRLTTYSLKDTGELENDATAVILIDKARAVDSVWRGEELVKDLEIIISKNRYGSTTQDDPLLLRWWPRWCRIEDVPSAGGGRG